MGGNIPFSEWKRIMDIFIKKEICRDIGQAMGREWLETNGLGDLRVRLLSG